MKAASAQLPAGGRDAVCWQCHAAYAQAVPFCPACGFIQPLPPDTDYFSLFGIARTPRLERAELDTRFYALSRRLHPDRYQTLSAAEQSASVANTAMLNRAYRTLRDPVERGRYWLRLTGIELAADNRRVPGELATLVFDVQEQLQEVRTTPPGTARDQALASVSAAGTAIAAEAAKQLALLQDNFARWAQDGDDRDALGAALKKILSTHSYLATLQRDIERALEASR